MLWRIWRARTARKNAVKNAILNSIDGGLLIHRDIENGTIVL